MAQSQVALLQHVNDCLVRIRRQQRRVRLLQSSAISLFISGLVITLYLAIWPSAHDKLLSLALVATTWIWPVNMILPVAALYLLCSFGLSVMGYVYLTRRSRALQHRVVSPSSFLLHLNRQHPSLEESAQLLAAPKDSLTVIQTLQLKRIFPALEGLVLSSEKEWLPKVSFKRLFFTNVGSVVFAIITLTSVILYSTSTINVVKDENEIVTIAKVALPANYLADIVVKVTPPAYTKQSDFEQEELNVSVLEGSTIEWFIPVPPNDSVDTEFSLTLSNASALTFSRNDTGYRVQLTAKTGLVYSIAQVNVENTVNTDIATVTVKQDRAPRITFKAPILTITEIQKSTESLIPTIVEINDDYALTAVKIIASIAKGSGEAVKFRDQEFTFDSVQEDGTSPLYNKSWDLRALDMEPGDELYFSVHATDNKQPTPQTTVSPIKIIRWLEDDKNSVTAGGVVLDFLPEYFKSQRQIIIETEALIEQAQTLDSDEFNTMSRGLGNDQSDLKQSYGQFLGDEFESGVMHNMEAGAEIPDVSHHEDEHDEHDEDSGSQHAEDNHEHEDHGESSNEQNTDVSGYQQVIEQFGHNHGEADIGFIKTQDGQISPKALMKRAIGAMWQAELHLRLSAPDQALPFEKEALAYLNRAKQADRIYVKRLGFEPPPVTEERRYTGKLKDILSYQRDTNVELTPSQKSQFVALIVLLNTHLTLVQSAPDKQDELSADYRLLIDDIAQHLTNKLNSEPEWITHIATLKRIQLSNSFTIPNCEDCLVQLLNALASQASSAIAQPFSKATPYSANHPSIKAYSNGVLNKTITSQATTVQTMTPRANRSSQP